jgi:DNA-binding CsgD family transcriptional regulator
VIEPVQPRATIHLILSAHGLTAREAEIAKLVLRGQSTRAIAADLHIWLYTVQDHLKAVFDKTGVRSCRDLVARPGMIDRLCRPSTEFGDGVTAGRLTTYSQVRRSFPGQLLRCEFFVNSPGRGLSCLVPNTHTRMSIC